MTKKKQSPSSNRQWISKLPFAFDQVTIIYAVALFMLVGAFFIWFFVIKPDTPTTETPTQQTEEEVVVDEEQPCEYRRHLDGVCVEFEDKQAGEYVAVMVENHVDSRPQSGISNARVVYEAPVEGNINRFMLLYDKEQDVPKVGPVRSARPYYLDWLQEFGEPMYMHVGGSPAALERIANENIFDMNEFSRGWYFWRSEDRFAPHNAYTSSELWQSAYDRYGDGREMNDAAWSYNDYDACEEDCTESISVVYQAPYYAAEWQYTSSTNNYTRYQMDRPHVDQDGSEIMADTIVVQYVQTQVLDNVGRISMETIGAGEAIVFASGQEIEGRWKKDSITDKTQFLDSNDEPIALQPGKIWITLVPQTGLVVTK